MSDQSNMSDLTPRALRIISCKRCAKLLPLNEINNEVCSVCSGEMRTNAENTMSCRGCKKPLPRGYENSHCPQCEHGRRVKWVTSETLQTEIDKQNSKLEALATQQTNTSELLYQILNKLNADDNNNTRSSLSVPRDNDSVLSQPIESESSLVNIHRDNTLDNESNHSESDHNSLESPGYSDISDKYDDTEDRCRSVASDDVVTVTPGPAAAGSEKQLSQLISVNSDNMDKHFGNQSSSGSSQENLGLRLSKLQEDSYDKILFTDKPAELRSYKDADKKAVPLHKSSEKYFGTLKINESIRSYITQSREKKGEKRSKSTIRSPVLRAIERDAYRVDTALKVGFRHLVQAQWALTELKNMSLGDSPTGMPVLIDKLFETLGTIGQQTCRASVINNNTRRRVYLNELGLRDSLVDKALILPMDKDGQHIFGGDKDVESLIQDFDTKDRQLNKATGAFKRPLNKESKKTDKYPYTESYKRPRYDGSSGRGRSSYQRSDMFLRLVSKLTKAPFPLGEEVNGIFDDLEKTNLSPQVVREIQIPAIPLQAVKVGGRLMNFVQVWEEITDDLYILDVLKNGYCLELKSLPPSTGVIQTTVPFQKDRLLAIRQEIWSLQQKNVIELVPSGLEQEYLKSN